VEIGCPGIEAPTMLHPTTEMSEQREEVPAMAANEAQLELTVPSRHASR
jgi:hypothetical protein